MTVQGGNNTTTIVEGDINNNNNHNNKNYNDSKKNDDDDIIMHINKTPAIFSLPVDIIREILSYLPASFLVHTLLRVSSYLKSIIQNENYWQNLWTTRQVAFFSHNVQLVKQAEGGERYMSITLSSLSGDHSFLLASVLQSQVPHLSYLKNNSFIKLSNNDDTNDNSLVHISIASDPLLLLSSNDNPETLTQQISRLAGASVGTERGKKRKPESGTQRVISRRRKSRNESIRLSKALCFLENSKSLGLSRPMIDDFNTLRLFLFSYDLPPQLSRRDGTPEEHESAFFDFINALVNSWKCCHPALQFTSTTTPLGLPVQQTERSSTFTLPSEEAETETTTTTTTLGITGVAVGATTTTTVSTSSSSAAEITTNTTEEKDNDGVFFSVSEPVLMPASLPLMTSSRLIVVPGTSIVRRLRFSLSDTLIYLFLLQHVSFSDIHQHVWNDERKCAICSRIVSPTGHAVELRFFTSTLLSVYPRFYVKMEFTQGDLPYTRIQEIFDQQRSCPYGPTVSSPSSPSSSSSSSSSSSLLSDVEDSGSNSNSNTGNPALASLFFGGYGRVEVDIPPTVSWHDFVRLRNALGLDQSFPMQLLWNVVMFAAGAGGDILQQQQPSFAEYYQTSFADAFAKGFSTAGSTVRS
ncbi:uncharacterized protein TM35_000181910 [Trypanosoma theileri]|uniref:F-box domain-containing protein n=1 Tax=Trypanosoma theileri TaxID=67003 RepID=A0A1X0NTU9_9TRYP|nr:uncharacterized protein TM35_000181910 [Trypanosoma theileri]ORC88134.1 hypothetical protein TM35_000181910 [Trypanosoma theileri]